VGGPTARSRAHGCKPDPPDRSIAVTRDYVSGTGDNDLGKIHSGFAVEPIGTTAVATLAIQPKLRRLATDLGGEPAAIVHRDAAGAAEVVA